ncbi:MAG: hypothetical protein QM775_35820 [Pirellulales bacterium]
MDNRIEYLNTDLMLTSPVDLRRLLEEFQVSGVYAMHDENLSDDGLWYASFETETQCHAPEDSIGKMLDAVETLTPVGRQLWDGCSRREFDIGFDCGAEPWAFNQGLSSQLLQRIAAAGASLRITLYPNRD